MYKALKSVFDRPNKKGEKKRVFLLLCSQVINQKDSLELIREKCSAYDDENKLYSFGFGAECDLAFIKKAAIGGQGEANYLQEFESRKLRVQVIDALSKASQPCLQGCQFDFGVNKNQADGLEEMGMKINNELSIVDPSVVL